MSVCTNRKVVRLTALLLLSSFANSLPVLESYTCWTGGVYNSKLGGWQWTATGEQVSVPKWAKNHPFAADRHAIALSDRHDFLMIDKKMQDSSVTCYMCERDAPRLSTCSEDWMRLGNRCYEIAHNADGLQWEEANNTCIQKNSSLVAIETVEEHENLRDLLILLSRAAPSITQEAVTSGPITSTSATERVTSATHAIEPSIASQKRSTVTTSGYTQNDVVTRTVVTSHVVRSPTTTTRASRSDFLVADQRPSAICVGVTAVFIMLSFFVGILLLDLTAIRRDLKQLRRNVHYCLSRKHEENSTSNVNDRRRRKS